MHTRGICNWIEACCCSRVDQSLHLSRAHQPPNNSPPVDYWLCDQHRKELWGVVSFQVWIGGIEVDDGGGIDSIVENVAALHYSDDSSHHPFRRSFLWRRSGIFVGLSVGWLQKGIGKRMNLGVVRWGS